MALKLCSEVGLIKTSPSNGPHPQVGLTAKCAQGAPSSCTPDQHKNMGKFSYAFTLHRAMHWIPLVCTEMDWTVGSGVNFFLYKAIIYTGGQ